MTTVHNPDGYAPQGWVAERLADKPGPQILALAEEYRQRPDVMLGQDDPFYAMFMAQVDRRLRNMVGLTHRDLADYLSYDDYESGVTPRESALNCLRQQDGYAELLDMLEGED